MARLGQATAHGALHDLLDDFDDFPAILSRRSRSRLTHSFRNFLAGVGLPHFVDLLFEVDVSSGLRTRPLQCFENSLAFGAEEWTYEEIESICYQLYRFRMGLNPLSEVYEFTLRTRAGRTERVRLVAAFLSSRSVKGDTDLLFQAMVSLLHDRVGRSRNLRYLSQLRAGETVRFGSIRLHRSGVRVRRGPFVRELAWDDVAGAEFVHGMVVVHRTLRDGGTKRCGSVSMSVDNAVLLSDLLPLAVERFGRRANRARRHASA